MKSNILKKVITLFFRKENQKYIEEKSLYNFITKNKNYKYLLYKNKLNNHSLTFIGNIENLIGKVIGTYNYITVEFMDSSSYLITSTGYFKIATISCLIKERSST